MCLPVEINIEAIGRVILLPEAIRKLKKYRQRSCQKERGGVLAGSLSHDGSWIVSHVMTPSKKSRSGKYWFERDAESADQYLNDLFEKSEGSVFYLGEWHTHPERSIEPSDKDLTVIADLIPKSILVADFLICVIVDSQGTLIVWAQSKTRILGLVILENESQSAG